MEQHAGDVDGGGDRRGAGRGRGRGGWTSASEHQIRRSQNPPVNQQTASVNQINEMFNNVAMNDVVKNSELSAEAAEFVPRSFIPPQGNQPNQGWQRHSVQDRLNSGRNHQPMHHMQQQQHHHYGSHQQYPYHVQQQMHYHQYGDSEQPPQSYQRYEGNYGNYDRNQQGNRNSQNNRGEIDLPNLLTQLTTAMNTLTRNPDQFENLVVSLVCNITPHLKNQPNTVQIIDAIMQKCIIDSNFRYSGARLCSHLDAVDTPSDDNPSIFRTALYERCREEAESQATNWPQITTHTPDDERKCHGLMLSLAELVAQLDSSGSSSILGKLLVELISNTLKNPGPNSAKFICQSLKLSGQYLERDSTNRQEIERVMCELTDLVTNGRVDVSVGRMVNSVRELRNGNWGRVVSSHGPTPADINQTNLQQQIPSTQQFDEPVLYGPDGMVLSAEERRFCQDLASMDGPPDDGWQFNSGDPTGSLEDDEDDIIAAAYEEFLLMEPNKNEGSGANRAK